ncbi:uncharacterized protein LOC144443866 [Glandiceps talaboti]
MLMQRNMAKQKVSVPLPKRPEPPSLEEMIEDIEKTHDDDIVFTLMTGNYSSPSTPSSSKPSGIMCDSYEEPSPTQPLVDMATDDNDACYEKAKKYMESNAYLKTADQKLAAQYLELQNAGQHLAQSIEQLKKETAKIKH